MNSTNSNKFVPLVNIYFQFFFVAGLTFQSILFYLIFTKSPSSLASMKYFLYNTCVIQILLVFVVYFTQHRVLASSTVFAVLAGGPCQYFGPDICFSFYHIFIGGVFCTALSISNTVGYRYLVLVKNHIEKKHIIGILLFPYITSLITIVIPFTSKWDFETVQKQSCFEHPTHDLSIYEPFSGFSNVQNFQFLSTTLLLAIGAYGIPILSALFTKKILKIINMHQNMSERTKTQARTLVQGLTCQTLMPLICYIPVCTSYIYSQITGDTLLFTEHLLVILTCFPALFDPFICFYFIVPYRQAIISFLVRKETSIVVTSAVST